MKKWSFFYILITCIVAASMTACSIDEDFNVETDGPLTITVDGQSHDYDQEYMRCLGFFGEYVQSPDDNCLTIVTPIYCDFQMEFPSDTNPHALFCQGYAWFEKDATRVTIGINERQCTYVSGSARITRTDASSFTVAFSSYKFRWNSSREITFNGTLIVPISIE